MFNTNIPGWNKLNSLTIIADYASKVPACGNILELGALFGRTTYTLGKAKLPSVKLTTIDWWITYHMQDFINLQLYDEFSGGAELEYVLSRISPNPDRIIGDDFFSIWHYFTSCIPNLDAIRDTTQVDNSNLPMYDFIFHDAGHDYDSVYADLNHWLPKLLPTGTFIIDDYAKENFPGLVNAVDQYVQENSLIMTPTGCNIAILNYK
jgi:hypothetical protein